MCVTQHRLPMSCSGSSREEEDVVVIRVPPHLSGSDGALQGGLVGGQLGVGLLQPGERAPVGVEAGLLVWRVQEPALEEQTVSH